jgi:hypothetical protein
MVKQKSSAESEFRVYVGLDWGTAFHRACVLDTCGEILRECNFDHNGQAITDFLRSLKELANDDPSRIAVAIEVPRGPVVEAFLEGGFAVFSINPKQLDRFRDRHTTAGAKDDRRDAYVARIRCGPTSIAFGALRPITPTWSDCANSRAPNRAWARTFAERLTNSTSCCCHITRNCCS